MSQKKLILFLILTQVLTAQAEFTASEVPEYEIDLDKPANKRYANFPEELCTKMKTAMPMVRGTISYEISEEKYNAFQRAAKSYINNNKNTEFVQELQSIQERCQISLISLMNMNFFQELVTVGCTSIIFKSKDGSLRSAQNLDYVLGDFVVDLGFKAKFIKEGKVVAKALQIFGIYGIFRALKPIDDGKNFLSASFNSRFNTLPPIDSFLYSVKETKVMPISATFRDSVLSSNSYLEMRNKLKIAGAIPIYFIINDNNEGDILEMNQDALEQSYKVKNEDENQWYLVQTNSDRENIGIRRKTPEQYFDRTGRGNVLPKDVFKDVLSVVPNFMTGYMRTIFSTYFEDGDLKVISWEKN